MKTAKKILIHSGLLVLVLGLFWCAIAQHQQLDDARNEIKALNKLHDADVEEMIRIDQDKPKPVKRKKHKLKPCEVIYVA